jgi:hypothetical protein
MVHLILYVLQSPIFIIRDEDTRKEISGILTSKLSSDEQLKALCLVGIENNLERCKSLSLALDKAKEDGYLGVSRFDSASGLFKPNQGWPE